MLQRDTRRYQYQNEIEVIDLGLSLADVEAMELEDEYQHHAKGSRSALELIHELLDDAGVLNSHNASSVRWSSALISCVRAINSSTQRLRSRFLKA
jgi:hypothetical protein